MALDFGWSNSGGWPDPQVSTTMSGGGGGGLMRTLASNGGTTDGMGTGAGGFNIGGGGGAATNPYNNGNGPGYNPYQGHNPNLDYILPVTNGGGGGTDGLGRLGSSIFDDTRLGQGSHYSGGGGGGGGGPTRGTALYDKRSRTWSYRKPGGEWVYGIKTEDLKDNIDAELWKSAPEWQWASTANDENIAYRREISNDNARVAEQNPVQTTRYQDFGLF